MVVVSKNSEKITVSFSGKVGKRGFERIKDYIEFLEKASDIKPRKKIPQAVINKLADEINEAAWQKFKKAKGL